LLAIEQNDPTSQLIISQSYPQNECFPKVVLTIWLPDSTLEVFGIVLFIIALPRNFFKNLDQM
jgi:hypothetical protein